MKNILIIEDDLVSHVIFKRLFQDFLLTFALNVKEGLLKLQQQKYDFIVVDVFLPDGNGEDLAKNIKSLFPDNIIIGISGNKDSVKCQYFDYFFEKPIIYSDTIKLKRIFSS